MTNVVLAAVVLAVVTIERIPRLRYAAHPFLRPYFATDLVCLLTGALGLSAALRTLAAPWAGRLPWETLAPAAVPLAGTALAIVLYDLANWALHRALHRFEPLWLLHKVHHSSRTLDWLATFRAHILEHGLRHLAAPVLLILIGFPVWMVAVAGVVYGGWATLGHANVRLSLGALEAVLVSPRLHRMHHVPALCERNFGTIFSWWDRLAGTLTTAAPEPLEPLGVPGEVETYPQSWPAQLVEPLRPRRPETLVSSAR